MFLKMKYFLEKRIQLLFLHIVLLVSINEKSDRTHLLKIVLRFISCSFKGFLQFEMLFRAFPVRKVLLYYL